MSAPVLSRAPGQPPATLYPAPWCWLPLSHMPHAAERGTRRVIKLSHQTCLEYINATHATRQLKELLPQWALLPSCVTAQLSQLGQRYTGSNSCWPTSRLSCRNRRLAFASTWALQALPAVSRRWQMLQRFRTTSFGMPAQNSHNPRRSCFE